ncbi:MAG: hypothetical protein L0H29_01630, partial [Sinobacteraceae bacterium]|nr:hypothetical protein [Nevskiaceae bacterium]
DRAGVNSNLSVANAGDDAHPDYVLKAPVEGEPGWAVHGLLDYGNIGNRYVGKDIVDGGMTVTAPFGGQLNLTAVSNIPGSVPGSLYREFAGSLSQVTPYGIFGVDGRYVMLHREFVGLHLREKIRQAGISWLFPIYVDFKRQMTFRAHATRNSLATRLTELPGIDVKSELYTALSLAFNYAQYLGAERHWQIQSGLGIEHGFGPHHTKLTFAQLDYWLFRPSITLKYAADAPWRVTLAMRGQLTSDTLPETKEWVLGGLNQLSAYHAGILVGDVGGVGTLRLAYANQPLWFATLTPAVFVEYGYSSQRRGIGNSPRLHGQQLADAGGSLKIALGNHLAARVSIADGFYDHNLDPRIRHAHRAIYMFRVTASF